MDKITTRRQARKSLGRLYLLLGISGLSPAVFAHAGPVGEHIHYAGAALHTLVLIALAVATLVSTGLYLTRKRTP